MKHELAPGDLVIFYYLTRENEICSVRKRILLVTEVDVHFANSDWLSVKTVIIVSPGTQGIWQKKLVINPDSLYNIEVLK